MDARRRGDRPDLCVEQRRLLFQRSQPLVLRLGHGVRVVDPFFEVIDMHRDRWHGLRASGDLDFKIGELHQRVGRVILPMSPPTR